MEVSAQPLMGSTMGTVLCCMCGVLIAPNSANTCASCLASVSDISRGISTEATLHQCRGCQRWHKDAGKWIACELESRELMALCLAHVSGLRATKNQRKIRLVDACWIWTEPHSMRLKVRLTVQREVESGTILQQSFTVIFTVRNQQCIECQAEFRQGSWKSLVQVRQRVSHKRTFLYLEQLIIKHGAHRGCLSIETFRDGMDFYFPDKGKAARFISFLENVCPIKVKQSKKLIGTDDKSNISNFKYTNLVEICPLCKDDLLYLPVKMARKMGNISRIVLVRGVSNVIHLLDPLTGQQASMEAEVFWREPIRPLITAARSRLSRYVVLGKEPVFLRQNISKRSANRKQKSRLASLTVAKEDDLGLNDNQYEEQSHVGYLLKAGDVCVGYDLKETQFVDDEAEEIRASGKFPDVIMLRKLYGGVATGEANAASKRIWRLQRLDVEAAETNAHARAVKNAAEADEMDEEDFMQEVEANKEMRQNMNIYKSEGVKSKVETADNRGGAEVGDGDGYDEDDDQQIRLDELLDSMALDSGPDDIVNPIVKITTEQFGSDFVEGERAAKDGLAYVARDDATLIREKDIAVPVSALGEDFTAKLESSTGTNNNNKK
jgi:nonsense-mediated mRNA decay protein 3